MDRHDDQGSQDNMDPLPGKTNPHVFDEDDLMLMGLVEERRGSKPGDVRVRIVRPKHPAFRRMSDGILEATEVTYAPHGPQSWALLISRSNVDGSSVRFSWM